LLLSLVFSYIYISQGSVETNLWFVEMYDNHIIANCPQTLPVKEFGKWSIIGENMDKSTVPHFCGLWCGYNHFNLLLLLFFEKENYMHFTGFSS